MRPCIAARAAARALAAVAAAATVAAGSVPGPAVVAGSLAAGALVFAGGAAAAEVAGVQVPAEASVKGQPLVLNGAGIRTRAIFKVYVASLYVPHRASDVNAVLAEAPRRVRLDLLRDLSAGQLVDALQDGLKANNTPAELEAVRAQVDELARIMLGFGEVKEKSVVTLDYVDGATQIGLDGAARGSIAGEAFNRALVRIWLGDHPVQGDLKKALLGG